MFGPRTAPKTNKGHGSHEHMGMDLAALNGEGTPIVAISAGKVTRVAYQSGYGNYVWIAQADGYGTVYGHLKRAAVKVGDHVNCRQVIGYEGATGNVSGPHLHLGMSRSTDYGTTHSNKNKYFFNPALYFGMQNVSTLKGKTFDGGGSPSGTYSTDTSTENTSEVVNSSSSTSSISFTNADSLVASGEYYQVTNFCTTQGIATCILNCIASSIRFIRSSWPPTRSPILIPICSPPYQPYILAVKFILGKAPA